MRLTHILEACGTIRRYIEGLDNEDFLNDPKTRDAIIYQLIIIGEAVIHTDNELLEKYNYPWFKIRAFRNSELLTRFQDISKLRFLCRKHKMS